MDKNWADVFFFMLTWIQESIRGNKYLIDGNMNKCTYDISEGLNWNTFSPSWNIPEGPTLDPIIEEGYRIISLFFWKSFERGMVSSIVCTSHLKLSLYAYNVYVSWYVR